MLNADETLAALGLSRVNTATLGGRQESHTVKKRRHHFVWQHYLEAWCQNDKVWAKRANQIFPVTTGNVALEKHFYRVPDLSDSDIALVRLLTRRSPPALREIHEGWIEMFTAPSARQRVIDILGAEGAPPGKSVEEMRANLEEDLYSRNETEAVPILAALRRGDTSFVLDRNTYRAFAHFIALQYFRTRRMRDRLVQAIASLERPAPFDCAVPESIAGLVRQIFATNLAITLMSHSEDFKLAILRSAASEFLTGDQPVINLEARGLPVGTPPDRLKLYYPLSPSMALVIFDQRFSQMQPNEIIDANAVGAFNSEIVAASQDFLFGHTRDVLSQTLGGE